uniref:Uncharacterized protein n=1 Tax=Arion vulgaris TaxID=1028688 RepID=A0A0B7AG14_9EUPU
MPWHWLGQLFDGQLMEKECIFFFTHAFLNTRPTFNHPTLIGLGTPLHLHCGQRSLENLQIPARNELRTFEVRSKHLTSIPHRSAREILLLLYKSPDRVLATD